jgi:hypothetical protein
MNVFAWNLEIGETRHNYTIAIGVRSDINQVRLQVTCKIIQKKNITSTPPCKESMVMHRGILRTFGHVY